jgi:hypothetical protein
MKIYRLLPTLVLVGYCLFLPMQGLAQLSTPDSSAYRWAKHFPRNQYFYGLGVGAFETTFVPREFKYRTPNFSPSYFPPSPAYVVDLSAELQQGLLVGRTDLHFTLARHRLKIANPAINYGHWHWELHWLWGIGLGLELFRQVRVAPVVGLGAGLDNYYGSPSFTVLAHARLPVSVRVWQNVWVGGEVGWLGGWWLFHSLAAGSCGSDGCLNGEYGQSYRFWNFKVIYNLVPKNQNAKPKPERIRESKIRTEIHSEP